MNVQAIAVMPGTGARRRRRCAMPRSTRIRPPAIRRRSRRRLRLHPRHDARARSPASPRATASPKRRRCRRAISGAARRSSLQTEYIIEQKILPALALAGSSAEKRLQGAGLSGASGGLFAPFMQVWQSLLRRKSRRAVDHSGVESGRRAVRCRGSRSTCWRLRMDGATRKQMIGPDMFVGYAACPPR